MKNDPISFLADISKLVMDYLEVIFALLILVAFGLSLAALTANILGNTGGLNTASKIIGALSSILLLGLLADVYGITFDSLLERKNIAGFLSLAIISGLIGILEEWVGSLSSLTPEEAVYTALTLSILIIVPIIGFFTTQRIESTKQEKN